MSIDEAGYVAGKRAVWLSLLAQCLRELGYDSPETVAARWVREREDTLTQLRQVCTLTGDNDWPDDLYLADVVENHVLPWVFDPSGAS